MKFVSVIAAGLIAGTVVPVAAHAQFVENLARRAVANAEPQRGRPDNAGRPIPRDMELIQGRGRGGGNGNPGGREREVEQPRPQAMRFVPLNAVVDAIRRSTPGRLLDASGPSGGDRPVYRIRWQADSGQRIDFVVDAQSGAILGRNGG